MPLRWLLGDAEHLVVLDVETTGVYNMDRTVEIAAVTLNRRGRIVDEWDTLINPERDVGPTHIHGITASMVSAAPTFSEISSALAERIDDAVLVAHNLPFDTRMLQNEFHRIGGKLDPGAGICTLRISGERLNDACSRFGVSLTRWHRALADARATAQLLRNVADRHLSPTSPARIEQVESGFRPRTLRRDAVCEAEVEMPYLARLADRLHHHGEHGAALAYLDQLDYALADLELSRAEEAQLTGLAADLGLSSRDTSRLHREYLDELIAAAARDGVVTDLEFALLQRVAEALGIAEQEVDQLTGKWRGHGGDAIRVEPGLHVCFTGAATYPDGSKLPRERLVQIASDLSWRYLDVLTKKVDVLIVADPSSQSGKAQRARQWGIPIISVEDFLHAQPEGTLRTH